jgi:hypothetical protein
VPEKLAGNVAKPCSVATLISFSADPQQQSWCSARLRQLPFGKAPGPFQPRLVCPHCRICTWACHLTLRQASSAFWQAPS